jgi:hypothetical protein
MLNLHIIASILAIAIICFWWSRRSLRNLADKIPGPTGMPFIGMAYKLLLTKGNGEFR